MSTQVLGGQQRSRVIVALVALALALAVFLLATQASSIWSSRGGAQVQPVPAQVATISNMRAVDGSQISHACRVKYGCHRGEPTISTGLASGGRIPEGCRIKFGC